MKLTLIMLVPIVVLATPMALVIYAAARHRARAVIEDARPVANLGYATTRQLLEEIKARGEVSHTIGEYPEEMGSMAIGAANLLDRLPGSMLNYRTYERAKERDG